MPVSRKGFSNESLQIGRNGAVIYQGDGSPSGTLGQSANLYIRKDSPNEKLYIKVNTTWKQLGFITTITTSNGITGGPITETGTLELTGQASELHNMSTDGFFYRNGATISARSFDGTNEQITVTNTDGSTGNPTFSITTNPTLPGNVTISGSDLIISGGNGRIQGINAVMSATDAASKSYVDGVAQGLSIKNSVIAATLNNITLSGEQTIDDVAVVDGNRILVKDQTDASENGIYIVSTGAWSRSLDMDDWDEVPSSFTFVKNGTINADTGWVITSLPGGSIDVDDINWVQFSGAGTYIGSNGINIDGQDITLTGQASAFHNLNINGIVSRTSAGNVTSRTLTGTADQIDITNGDGITGNPTFVISDNVILPGLEGMEFPKGDISQRNVTPNQGVFRFNSETNYLEYYRNDIEWRRIASIIESPSSNPSYNIIATPEIVPYELNVTRATVGTRFTNLGNLEEIPANEIRHNYDNKTGEYLGWLIEPESTNIIFPSNASSWNASGGSITVLSLNALNYFNGLYIESNGNVSNGAETENGSITNATTYTITTYFRLGNSNEFRVILLDGATTNTSFITGDANGIISTDNTFGNITNGELNLLLDNQTYELKFNFTPNATTSQFKIILTPNSATATENIIGLGAQVEEGEQSTSFIETTTTTVTRNSDDVIIDSIQSWINNVRGSVYIEGYSKNNDSVFVSLNNGTLNQQINTYNDGADIVSGATTYNIFPSSNLINKSIVCLSYNFIEDEFKLSINGNHIGINTISANPTFSLSQINLGSLSDFSNTLNGHIKQVAFIPTDLSISEITELTEDI